MHAEQSRLFAPYPRNQDVHDTHDLVQERQIQARLDGRGWHAMRRVRVHARLRRWVEEEASVSVESSGFSRMDLHPARHTLAVDIYHSASILELPATVEPDQLGSFFPVSPSLSTPAVPAISASGDCEEKCDCSYALTGLFGERVLPLPFVYRGYEPVVEAVEEA